MFKKYIGLGYYWFRLFGFGFAVKDTSRHGMLFSERYGYVKYFMIGKWLIKPLKKLAG